MLSPWSGENSGTWSVENSETCLPCYLCAEVKIELAGMQKHPRHIHGQGFLREALKKKPDYLMTLIKRVGGYLAEITSF